MRVLPVVNAVAGWCGRISILPSRRIELKPPRETMGAPARIAHSGGFTDARKILSEETGLRDDQAE